jgi:tripartite-type tricarboxylate transporter receptor subunit TctC
MITKTSVIFISLMCFCCMFGTKLSHSQEKYPSRSIEVVIGFTPGGTPDTITRVFGDEFSRVLKVPVVPTNKVGASGTIASTYVAQAGKDGYTLLSNAGSGMVLARHLLPGVTFETLRDFTPIGIVGTSPAVLYVNEDSPLKSFEDLVNYAKKNPGKLTGGSPGTGTDVHFFMEQLQVYAGIKVSHVPFKGGGEVQAAVLGGHVDFGLTTMAGLANLIRAKTVRVLVSGSEKRIAAFPDIPTASEKGYRQHFIGHWTGLFAPSGTPDPIVKVILSAYEEVVKSKTYIDKIQDLGCEVKLQTQAEFRKFIEEDDKAAAVIAKQIKQK